MTFIDARWQIEAAPDSSPGSRRAALDEIARACYSPDVPLFRFPSNRLDLPLSFSSMEI
jgi:hypothetical protein